MLPKRWHAIRLAVAVGVVTIFAVGASLGPDSIGFWTGELLALLLPYSLSGTMYWRRTEGVTVAIMVFPGLVLALLVYAKARPGPGYAVGCCRSYGYDLWGNTSGRFPSPRS